MTIIREDLINAVFTRLDTTSASLVEIMPSAESDVTPRLSIDDQGQSVIEREAVNTRYSLRLAIEGVVEADPASSTPGPNAWARMNALYAEVIRVLMPDPPLGGLAEDISETDFNTDVSMLASDRTIAFVLGIEIQFTNRSTDPALS